MASAEFWRRALRRLFAIYLFVSGIALIFPHRPRSWWLLAALHVAGILLLLGVGPAGTVLQWFRARWPRAARLIGDWYALLLVPALYTELATLNVAVHNGAYFDDLIIHWEAQIFGGQPSRELAAAYPYLWLSEFLHFAYISYYLIIYGPFLLLYLRGRIDDHQRAGQGERVRHAVR